MGRSARGGGRDGAGGAGRAGQGGGALCYEGGEGMGKGPCLSSVH